MAVKIQISGQDKVVADVIATGLITLISSTTKIYTGSSWLTCDGSAVSRTTYADLFAVIGTTFGAGDGTSTFNIPNANSIMILKTTVGTNTTFAAFGGETIISCTNSGDISIDISAGATAAGVRLTIIEKTAHFVTVTTAVGVNCVLPIGMIVLEWDGTQWCLVGETVRILVTKTSSTTWTTPFGAVYKLSPVGGGGGGGGANVQVSASAYGGGGAGGSCQQFSKYIPAGQSFTITIGTAGAAGSNGGGNGGAGGDTIIDTNEGTQVFGKGGGGGGGTGSVGMGTYYGTAGASTYLTTQIAMSLELLGKAGGPGAGSSSGAGGKSACNGAAGGGSVGGNSNGNSGSSYGGGGSGASRTSDSGGQSGGAGAAGVAYIEY